MLIKKLLSLPAVQILHPQIHRIEYDNLSFLRISNEQCDAIISLHGAQLIHWQPKNEYPVIWLSNKSQFLSDKAIRGGVPICWPWFGPVHSPSHGFARISLWKNVEFKEIKENISIALNLVSSTETKKIWDHDFSLKITFILGNTCEILLNINSNTQTTTALHTYFHVKNIENIKIHDVNGEFIDKTENNQIKTSIEPLSIQQETDSIYTNPKNISIIEDLEYQRTIEIEHINQSDVVVWNPWTNAKNMNDMEENGYKTMICIETARIHKPITNETIGLKIRVK